MLYMLFLSAQVSAQMWRPFEWKEDSLQHERKADLAPKEKARLLLQLYWQTQNTSFREAEGYLKNAQKLLAGQNNQALTATLLHYQAASEMLNARLSSFRSLKDSALVVAKITGNDSLLYFLHSDFGFREWWVNANGHSIENYHQAFLYAEKLNDPQKKVEALIGKAMGHIYTWQVPKADSVLILADSLAKQMGTEYARLEVEFAKSWSFYQAGNVRETLARAGKGEEECKKSGLESTRLRFVKLLAQAHYHLGEYPEAMGYYHQLLAHFQNKGDRFFAADYLKRISYAHRMLGNFGNAIAFANQAKTTYDSLGYPGGSAGVNYRLYEIYLDNKQFDKAEEVTREALAIFRELDDDAGMANSYNAFGNIFEQQKELEKSLDAYKMAYSIRKNHAESAQVIPLYNIGNINVLLGNGKESLSFFRSSLAICEKQNILGMKIRNLLGLAEANLLLGHQQEARKLVDQALPLVVKTRYQRMKRDAFGTAAKVYAANNSYEKAYEAHMQHKALEDSLFNEESNQRFARLEVEFETREKEQENKLLKKDINLKEADLHYQQRIIAAIAVILALSVAGIFFFVRNNRILSAKNQEINQQKEEIDIQNEQLLISNNKLEDANRDKARLFQLIGHDLRGPIGSFKLLSDLIPMYVEENDMENLYTLNGEIAGSVQNIQSLLDNLLSWSLDETGQVLIKSVTFPLQEVVAQVIGQVKPAAQAKNISVSSQIPSELCLTSDPDILKLILRNLLSNALKFTPSEGSVSVSARAEEQQIALSITDTGVGIPPEKAANLFTTHRNEPTWGTAGEKGTGLGLLLVKKFASYLNGDLILEKTSSEGTTFTIII